MHSDLTPLIHEAVNAAAELQRAVDRDWTMKVHGKAWEQEQLQAQENASVLPL